MNFVSHDFVIFLICALSVFFIAPAQYRWLVLLLASYLFYASWSIPFLVVILLTTSIDYCASLQIHINPSPAQRKSWLWFAIGLNVITLAFFKYFNFFLDVQAQACCALHLGSALPKHLEILLPLGISYYTFEAISYLVDVYRGAKPAPTWWSYNFYIMYFPHLISGPIVRFNELWKQYQNGIQLPTLERFGKGLELLILGYFFKTVIANTCVPLVDPVFAHPQQASVLDLHQSAIVFSTQIYFDFLGYTHIARGVSLLFNLELPINFDHPLNATSMANFWQRWQISLSRWLHDYLYIPLGGSRKSIWSTMRNVFITLLVAGIWHGAGWSYVILGGYFGCVVALYHLYRRMRKKWLKHNDKKITQSIVYRIASHLLTFSMIIYSSVLFRAPNLETDWIFTTHLFRFRALIHDIIAQAQSGSFEQIATCIFCICLMAVGPLAVRLYRRIFMVLPYSIKVQTAATAVLLCWITCAAAAPSFIYFQF